MLDIKKIVNDTEKVGKALLKRMDKSALHLERIVSQYHEYKSAQQEFEKKRAEQKTFNDKIASLDKKGKEFKAAVSKMKQLSKDVKKLESVARELYDKMIKQVEVLPNIPDDDVPAGGKGNNEVVKEHLTKPEFDFEPKDHVELATKLGLVDFERASKMAGAQFVMYRGDGALLEWALINFFVHEHLDSGYEMILPPHLLTEESAYVAGQLPKFRDDVYWVQDGNCLLPTAETALANLYRDEVLDEQDLPKKLFSYTPCYRREAGSYRAKERGLMRIHQFNKVEMFQYTTEKGSEDALDEMVNKACELVEKLGLHFRVSKLAAGDCSAPAAKTLDIEVWMPFIGEYYEVSSASNARDFQARRGNIRYKPADGGKPKYAHMLNASGLATSRLMVAILESYQQRDGSINVPEVLQDYVGKSVLKQ